MTGAVWYILIGVIGIFAGKFFKKFAEKQKAKLEEQKREKENNS
jgi:uncharacterized membrane protein YuzA (DUF378 family)